MTEVDISSFDLSNPYSGMGKYNLNLIKCLRMAGTSFRRGASIIINSGFQKAYKRKENHFTINIIHDIYPLIEPYQYNIIRQMITRYRLNSIKQGDMIIANSEFTKKEVEFNLFGNPGLSDKGEEKVKMIYCPVDYSVFKEKSRNKERELITYVGSEEPRQNLEVLLSALQILAKNDKDFKFIKVGKPNWNGGRDWLKKQLRSKDLESRTQIVDKMSDNQLVSLLNKTNVFVYPCYYGGFGYPPIEAIACGATTIVSNMPPMQEITNGLAKYANYDSPEDFAKKIERALDGKYKRITNIQKKKTLDRYSFEEISEEWKLILSEAEYMFDRSMPSIYDEIRGE